MSRCTQWVDRGVIACKAWASSVRASCSSWATRTRTECAQQATVNRTACDRWEDEGHNECASWADQGHNACCDWIPCSWFCNALVWIAEWVCHAWHWVANWVCKAWHTIVEVVCIAWSYLVEVVCIAYTWLVVAACTVWSWIPKLVCVAWTAASCSLITLARASRNFIRRRPRGARRIKRVFVLMLENRSYDHMLGFAGLSGSDARTGAPRDADDLRAGTFTNPSVNGPVSVAPGADFKLSAADMDPPHEFLQVVEQLAGDGVAYAPPGYPTLNNQGFVSSYEKLGGAAPAKAMAGYTPAQLPVLNTLAREFAVCDRWFSSMPGPTWPNRFFAHCATAGGLDHSPSGVQSAIASLIDGFRFWNGSIFDKFEDACLPWQVVEGDELPVTFALSGMSDYALAGHFTDFEDFPAQVARADYAHRYTFIEPNYGNILPGTPGDFTCGNSQHPLDDVTRGEKLIKDVYEAIRSSPHWNESVLIVTWDEHGGFYDHVQPPAAVAPGDPASDPSNQQHGFGFTQLGVRVPAVVISPWIAKGVIDNTTYDHSSIPATLERLFGFRSMTARDSAANDLLHLFTQRVARGDAPMTLPEPAESGFRCTGEPLPDVDSAQDSQGLTAAAQATRPIPTHLHGFLYLALRRRLADLPPGDDTGREALIARYRRVHNEFEARLFIHQSRMALRARRRNRRAVSLMHPKTGDR
jgi:phospholipase C